MMKTAKATRMKLMTVSKKNAVGDDRDVGFLGGFNRGVVGFAQGEEAVGKINPTGQGAERRHDHVGYQGVHHLAEGGADDHADGQVNDVAAGGKFLEFLEEGADLFDLFDGLINGFHGRYGRGSGFKTYFAGNGSGRAIRWGRWD